MGGPTGVSGAQAKTEASRLIAVHETADEPVDFPALARELGLTRQQRAEILRARLVTPVDGKPRQGAPTLITADSADLLREARRVLDWVQQNPAPAVIAGVTLIVILRLLASGAVQPSVP
jgi:hypothetical protein